MNNLKTPETDTLDRLFLELSQFTQAQTKKEIQYDQLIYAVECKFPGESRFETALRYIRERENRTRSQNNPCQDKDIHDIGQPR